MKVSMKPNVKAKVADVMCNTWTIFEAIAQGRKVNLLLVCDIEAGNLTMKCL